MWCEECGDIVAPYRQNRRPRACQCGRYSIWWENSFTGVVRVYDAHQRGWRGCAVWVVGLANSFLSHVGRVTPDITQGLLDEIPDSYLFKRQNSLVIKFRPAETSDSAFASALPQWPAPAEPTQQEQTA